MTHIERLLLVHDCVIIPRLGGFVLQTIPATYVEAEHLFRPMRKDIVFNTTLQHNDGLLSESYMQQYGVDFRTARLMLEEDTKELNTALQECREISLGTVGFFRIGNEGQVVFLPGEATPFSISSYGLPLFHMASLQALQAEEERLHLQVDGGRRKDTYYLPINRRLIRIVAASVAAVALFLLVSTPVRDVNQSAYTASFIPTERVMSRTPEPEAKQLKTQVEAPAAVTSEKVIAVPVEAPAKKAAPAEAAPKVEVKNPKMYHIVIASFPTEVQAADFMAGIDRKECKEAGRVKRDGKIRIYANKFESRDKAETYMATLKTNPKYKDAWLFISR